MNCKQSVTINQRYKVEHFGAGTIFGFTHIRKSVEFFDNLVVTEGRNKYLDATLKTGLASPAWYVGLKDAGTVVAGDTLTSHAGWAELAIYSGNRPAWTPGSVASGSVDNSASKASFTATSADTVYGCFLCSAATGTSGTLLGAGDFTAPKALEIADVLQITVTCSMTAS